jgi:hypothetical protein
MPLEVSVALRVDLRHPRTESPHRANGDAEVSPVAQALGLIGFLAWVIVAVWIGALLQLEFTATCLGALGLVYGTLTVMRPSWYWSSPQIIRLRSRLGEQGTRSVSLAVCSVLIAAAAFREVRLSRARSECNRLVAASSAGVSRTTAFNHRIAIGISDYITGQGISCLNLRARGP